MKGHHGGRDHILPLCLKGHPKGELNHICPLEGQGRRHFIRLVHYNGSLEGILPPFFPTGRTLYCVLSIGWAPWRALHHILSTSSGDIIMFYLQQGPQRWYFCCAWFFVSNIRLMSPSVGPLPRVVLETCIINIATVSKIIYVRPSSES